MQLKNLMYSGAVYLLIACHMGNEQTADDVQTKTDLEKINQLLRDSSFAATIANHQEAGYANANNTKQPVPSPDSITKKSFKDDKIATNLAGFYAVECGVGAISKTTGKKPIAILQQLVDNRLATTQVLLLNRFANATWKASQPFRGMERIKRDNFIVAAYLSKEEIKKDYDQVVAAATLLLTKLKGMRADAPAEEQFAAIEKLMKDKAFANEMAAYMEAAYYAGQGEPAPIFIKPGEDTAVIMKSAAEERLAVNLAGFYALECGVEYLSSTTKQSPAEIVKAILADRLDNQDKELLERFANATWKAGQPFRGLDRITRDIFKPFDLLPPDEVDKDWHQIKMAATLLNKALSEKQPPAAG